MVTRIRSLSLDGVLETVDPQDVGLVGASRGPADFPHHDGRGAAQRGSLLGQLSRCAGPPTLARRLFARRSSPS